MNVDLVQYLTKAKVFVPIVEVMEIPTQMEKVKNLFSFDQVDDPPIEDSLVML
jgi:hypothetical protein